MATVTECTPDLTSIARSFRADRRRTQRLGFMAIAPTMAFLVFVFFLPIGVFLMRAVDNADISNALPRTEALRADWRAGTLPPDEVYAAIAADLSALDDRTAAILARNLNYRMAGYRGLILRSRNRLAEIASAPSDWSDWFVELDRRWANTDFVSHIRNDIDRLTEFYFLTALDLEQAPDGSVREAPPQSSIFRGIFLRTFGISLAVTVFCAALGFPVGYVIAQASAALRNWLILLILVPFWTSLLVRTAAWVILLQQNGLINDGLIALGILAEPIALIYNRTGVYIAMTHVLLPFFILPQYSVMTRIDPHLVKASASLGARPVRSFLSVYLPQALPGTAAGATLVFVIALGYYVTPALVGGPSDQMISTFVAFYTNESVNWGLAAALGSLLLAALLVSYVAVGATLGFKTFRTV